MNIRPALNSDTQDLFGLLALCFAEYPGCFVDPHDDLKDMLAPETSYSASGGAFWVIEDERGRVGACCGVSLPVSGIAELHRLYVRPDMRRRGLARRFIQRVEAFAKEAKATKLILWSDTRFTNAHQLYLANGFTQVGNPKPLGDISNSMEYAFEKNL